MTTPQWLASIHHDGSPCYVRQTGGTATLRLRADTQAPIQRVFVRAAPDGEQRLTPMRRGADQGVCQWWDVELPRAMPRDGYRFFLHTDAGSFWLAAAGITRHTPTDATDFKLLGETTAPAWVREAVFYQIFPDRFYDGDPANNVKTGEYRYRNRPVVARGWDELPTRAYNTNEFFGGDLQGIVQKLDYVQELGVSALYLTPIFTSPSNHKYDSASYEQVDPHFGGNQALVALREALDRRGMQLVLDLVPNHSGDQHPWFTTAQADANAPEAEFYTFRTHPDEYESWFGISTLPKLNYRSEGLRERMYAGENAIVRHWMRSPYRIDGWRIDVANMLARQGDTQGGHKVGRGLRRAMKAENPQSYLLGENFYDGTPHLQGEELDATMNYRGFMIPLQQWLAGDYFAQNTEAPDLDSIPAETMAAQWNVFLAALPYQIALQQFNLLGSHDTPRITTVLGGDKAHLKVARTLLYMFPGVPCVYYGDEIGLEGGPDPDNRRPMPWDESRWNHELLAREKQLIQLRRSSPALHHGGYQLLHAEADSVAFLREAPEERLIIVACRAAQPAAHINLRHAGLANGMRLREHFSKREQTVADGQFVFEATNEANVEIWRVVS